MKKFTFLCLIATAALSSSAFTSGKFNYNIVGDNEVEIARPTDTSQDGAYKDVTSFPSSVTYGGTTYTVVGIGERAFQYCESLYEVTIVNPNVTIGANAFANCYSMGTLRFEGSAPTVANSNAFTYLPTSCLIFVPYSGLSGYLGGSNYPSTATYIYLGFATYTSGNTLPAQDSTSAYNVTWYASVADAKAGTNPITQGNGNEVYCTWAAV